MPASISNTLLAVEPHQALAKRWLWSVTDSLGTRISDRRLTGLTLRTTEGSGSHLFHIDRNKFIIAGTVVFRCGFP